MNSNNGQLGFLDLLNIASFVIGLMNLEENLTQGDKQDLLQSFSDKADLLLREIHGHLESQDAQIKEILQRLEELQSEEDT